MIAMHSALKMASKSGNPSLGELQEVLNLFSRPFLQQRIAVLIDNVQSLDGGSLRLLNMIVDSLNGTIGQNVILLSFNEDELIYSQDALAFYQSLKSESKQSSHYSPVLIDIPEFDENSVKMFLNTICRELDNSISFTEHYPRLTQLICDRVLPRPLDIYQLFLAAQDENNKCAVVENGFFFVKNLVKFIELVNNLQGKTEHIYKSRLSNLQSNTHQLRLILVLSCVGDIDYSVLLKISKCHNGQLQRLINMGWIRQASGNRISFFHPTIERFVLRCINGEITSDLKRIFSSSLKHEVYQLLESAGYSSLYRLASFFLTRKKSKTQVELALEEVRSSSESTPSIRAKVFSEALLTELLKSQSIKVSTYIDCIFTLSVFASEGKVRDLQERLLTIKARLHNYVPQSSWEAKFFLDSTAIGQLL
jgi:hypothetical protein